MDSVSSPGYPGLPEREPDPEQVQTFLTAMKAEQFDLCIQMHGSGGITNGLTTTLRCQAVRRLF